jgi:hypothetical protein
MNGRGQKKKTNKIQTTLNNLFIIFSNSWVTYKFRQLRFLYECFLISENEWILVINKINWFVVLFIDVYL